MEIHQVPVAYRRKRIADWYAFRDESHGWGDYWLPPIFVVTDDSYATDQWARAVVSAGDRRQVTTLDILMADIQTIFSHGFLNTAWTKPDGTCVSGFQGLSGRNEPGATFARWLPGDKAPRPLPRSRPQLQAWANQVAGALPGGKLAGTSEELGALSLVLPATDKTAVEFLGEHPMLTPWELGVMLRLPRRRAERLVFGLTRDHLIESLPPLGDEPSGEPRYLLTELGLKLLAARAGVPYRAYVRSGPFLGRTQDREVQHRLGPLLYHPEHTAGINRFMASMAASLPGEAPRLTRWFGTSESTFWLTHDESRNWLQPDALGNLHWKGKTRRFFLEWDRGTMRWQEMREKFDRYASLYSSFARSANPWTPDTVIVTSSPQREGSIWERWQSTMAENEVPPSLLLTSVESLVTRLGPFGRVWRTSAGDLVRYTWGEAIDLWDGTADD
jgi:hypothetical protein